MTPGGVENIFRTLIMRLFILLKFYRSVKAIKGSLNPGKLIDPASPPMSKKP